MLSVRFLFSILTCCFVILYVGALIMLITRRIGILSLCSFSCALSVGGESFFWFTYSILCLSMLLLHYCNVLCISFWCFSVGSLGRVRKWLTARNVWTFSTYVSVCTSTIVLPISTWTIIAFSVTSFCFSCFMTSSCLVCSMF